MKIEPEDFKAWRDQAITEFVFKRFKERAEQLKELWVHEAWNTKEWDPFERERRKAEAQMLIDIANLSYEDIKDEE